MNRPLALIQGNLALPNARLLRGLPPPYGVYRWPARNAAQQSIQDAVLRSSTHGRHSPIAPGQKSRFFYKLQKPRDNSTCFDAQLAEARHYLEMGEPRRCSSRVDHVLGGMIFVACSIVLAWLLIANATRDPGTAAAAAITLPSVAIPGTHVAAQPQVSAGSAQQAVEITPKFAQYAPSAEVPTPRASRRNEPRPLRHAALSATPGANSKSTPVRQGESQLDEHRASTQPIRPAPRPGASTQPERTPYSSLDEDAHDQTPWPDRTAQQPPRANVITRASASAPSSSDTDWNAHMTQRRITDNPTVFLTPTAQN